MLPPLEMQRYHSIASRQCICVIMCNFYCCVSSESSSSQLKSYCSINSNAEPSSNGYNLVEGPTSSLTSGCNVGEVNLIMRCIHSLSPFGQTKKFDHKHHSLSKLNARSMQLLSSFGPRIPTNLASSIFVVPAPTDSCL